MGDAEVTGNIDFSREGYKKRVPLEKLLKFLHLSDGGKQLSEPQTGNIWLPLSFHF